MKKIYTLIMVIIAITFSTHAQQIQNGSFEVWDTSSPSKPVGWDSFDDLVGKLINGVVQKGWCTKDTTVHYAGSASCKLRTDSTSGVGNLQGFVAYGVIVFDSITQKPTPHGTPFTGRPTAFTGALNFAPVGSDTALYELLLTKWDATGDSEIVVAAINDSFSTATGGNWVTFNDTIVYNDTLTPDTLLVVFQSNNSHTIGTTLWVDDLGLNYSSAGIVHLNMDDAITIYPNPATTSLNIRADAYMAGYAFDIITVDGRIAKHDVLSGSSTSIDVSMFAPGTYLYSVKDNNQKTVQQSKFELVR